MLMNPITTAQDNFLDISHIRVDILELMVRDTLNACQCDFLGDFSAELNQNNIHSFFETFDKYIKTHQSNGQQASLSSYHDSSFEVEIKPGSYVDLFLESSYENHKSYEEKSENNIEKSTKPQRKSINLCIEGKGDFSLVKVDAMNNVSSKIYQQRKDCRFVINEMNGIHKLRIVPLFNYPLKLTSANFEKQQDN